MARPPTSSFLSVCSRRYCGSIGPPPAISAARGERAPSLALQRALLGPMSRDEKIALGVGIGLLLGFMTQPLHHVDPAWVAVLAAGVLAATRVVTVNTLRAVNWNFALLFGVLISLATVFARTGLDRWMAERQAAAAGDLSAAPVVFVVVLALLCFAIGFVGALAGRSPAHHHRACAGRERGRRASFHRRPDRNDRRQQLLAAAIRARAISPFTPVPAASCSRMPGPAGGARLRLLDHCRRRAQRAGLAVDGAAVSHRQPINQIWHGWSAFRLG